MRYFPGEMPWSGALARVGRVMVRVQRDDPEEVTIAVRDGPDLLAQPEGIGGGAVRRANVSNRLPLETGVAVDGVPVQLAQAAERSDHHLQLRELETKEYLLELGAVEVELDAATSGGHAAGSDASVSPSTGSWAPTPAPPSAPPTPALSRFSNGRAPAGSRAGSPGPSSPLSATGSRRRGAATPGSSRRSAFPRRSARSFPRP